MSYLILIGKEQTKSRNKKFDYKLITFFILPPSKKVLFERLSNRDMKDKLIAEERMKQFSRDVLHWINYDYVVVNDNLENCYLRIINLIKAELSNGSKDYDLEYIRKHVEKLTSVVFHIHRLIGNKYQNLNFEVLELKSIFNFFKIF